jgi:polysaccharide pyruvyl transferase WcaK-like protein
MPIPSSPDHAEGRRDSPATASSLDRATMNMMADIGNAAVILNVLNICLIGAATDTSNLGVSALCYSMLAGIARRFPNAQVTVFDNGRGQREASLRVDGRNFIYRLCGGKNSRRYYQPESYQNIRFSSWLGGLGNRSAQALLAADVILDVSGGDSFCDLYGERVFRGNTFIKRLSLAHGLPLVLLPQTYGPFNDPRHRKIAERIVARAAMAWARDRRSFDTLRKLLGNNFNPQKHLCGVDLAFGLQAVKPDTVPPQLFSNGGTKRVPLVGLNISGLIYNAPELARSHFGLKADYCAIIHELVRRLLQETDCRLMLVPHVLSDARYVESDGAACATVFDRLSERDRQRVFVLPRIYDPSETKWIISHCDWFCGTRMHSTIAGLSSGVPTAAIAYSLKTAGVFESCGQGEHVADPRTTDTQDVIAQLWRSWQVRDAAKLKLDENLPRVFSQVEFQLDAIAQTIRSVLPRSVIQASVKEPDASADADADTAPVA